MTREEIKDFCDMKAQLEPENEDIYKAIVKALEQEPTTKNDLGDDAVRRKAVLNTLDNMDSALDDEDRTVETYKELLKECYKVLPSVTPQEPILDKIRAEIAEYGSIMVAYAITKNTKTDKGIEKLVRDVLKQAKKQVLAMIDKYKAESEGEDGEID